jgi:hypothetical protein
MANESEKAVVISPVRVPVPTRAAAIPAPTTRVAATQPGAAVEGKLQEDGKPTFRFAKLWGVSEVLRFKDGSIFQFKAIRRNNAAGFSPTSSVVTKDEVLAANLRGVSKTNKSVREAPAK